MIGPFFKAVVKGRTYYSRKPLTFAHLSMRRRRGKSLKYENVDRDAKLQFQFDNNSRAMFKRRYRLNKGQFRCLARKLEDYFKLRASHLPKASGVGLSLKRCSVKVRLAVTLRYLAGGSYIDICGKYIYICVLSTHGSDTHFLQTKN